MDYKWRLVSHKWHYCRMVTGTVNVYEALCGNHSQPGRVYVFRGAGKITKPLNLHTPLCTECETVFDREHAEGK